MISVRVLDKIIQACLIGFAAFSMFSISLTQLCAGIGAVTWLVRIQITQSWKEIDLPLGWLFLAFVVACVLAVVTSVDPLKSMVMLKKTFLIAIFFWVVNVSKDEYQKEFLLKILMVSACLAALYGVSQAVLLGVSKSTRVEGTMSIYMTFAGVLMLASLMGLGQIFFSKRLEILTLLGVSLSIICLLLTLTRQAWLGLMAGTGFLLFVRQKKWLIALPVILGVAYLFSSGAVRERLGSLADFKDRTLQIRLQLWKGGWEIFKDHPITGCGFKCVDTVYPQYPEQAKELERYKGMHNNLIQVAVDTGVVGLGAWVSIWVGYFFVLFKQWENLVEPSRRWIVLGSGGAVIGFQTAGIFEVNFYDSEVIMLLYFLMALPLARGGILAAHQTGVSPVRER